MNKYYALGAIIMAGALAGCNQSAGSHSGASFEVVADGAVYTLANSAREFGTDEDISFSDSVSLILPSSLFGADVKPLCDSIVKLAFDTVGVSTDASIDSYLESTVARLGYPYTKIEDAADLVPDGFNKVSGKVVNLSPELLVYCVTTSDYQPRAAHGMTTNFYINYSIAHERVLTFADLFETSKLPELVNAIQTHADAIETLIGPTTVSELPAGNNFKITPGGEIEFVYQPYEVASYAQGTIRVPFYPYELATFMTPFGRQYFNISDI
ncbi:MAG: RsiV family protein [Muribaculaceae bacterium]|nr:RsiV family protein [Muribaculaceae bacterium]